MSKKLFTPGPSNVPQNIKVQLAKDIIHHRMKDFHRIFKNVTSKLKQIFKTKSEVIILTSSGTGAMESAVVNLFSKLDEVLVINTGYFGERFIEICNVYGLIPHQLNYDWGNTYSLSEIESYLKKHPNIKGLFLTHHETSTGVVNNVELIGELLRGSEVLYIVDSISGLIANEFEFDTWNVDCALASSQKGFSLPPGLSFVALSQNAIKKLPESDLPKFYNDYSKYLEFSKKGETPFTPAIQLITALEFSLNDIVEKGINSIVNTKIALRKYTEDKLKELGFTLFIKDENIRGNVLIPVLKGDNLDVDLSKLVSYLDERHNLQVSKGQGKYSDLMLRVGIISDFTQSDIDDLITKIDEFIND
jgi:aspartate aminotransferase-like enzyme